MRAGSKKGLDEALLFQYAVPQFMFHDFIDFPQNRSVQ